MGVINCCHYCVAPKRHPGCHSNCPEHAAEKAEYDRLKAADDEKRKAHNNIYNQKADVITKAIKRHGRH